MNHYEQAMKELNRLFARDYQFAMATTGESGPSIRFVDTYYTEGAFYIVTNRQSRKVKDTAADPRASLCGRKLHDGGGVGVDEDHLVPFLPKRQARLRARVVKFRRLTDDDGTGPDDENPVEVCAFRHVDGRDFQAAFAKLGRVLPHGQGVQVDHTVNTVVIILQQFEITQGADIVAEREQAGRLNTGEDNGFMFGCGLGLHGGFLLQYAEARLREAPWGRGAD